MTASVNSSDQPLGWLLFAGTLVEHLYLKQGHLFNQDTSDTLWMHNTTSNIRAAGALDQLYICWYFSNSMLIVSSRSIYMYLRLVSADTLHTDACMFPMLFTMCCGDACDLKTIN